MRTNRINNDTLAETEKRLDELLMTPKIQRYVVGFMFDVNESHVLLIEKIKPEWMRGRLNGIGGKIEPGESPQEAMIREFKKEVGISTEPLEWNLFCTLRGAGFEIAFFCAVSDAVWNYVKMEEERPILVNTADLTVFDRRIMTNLRWLIPLALSMKHERCGGFEITEREALIEYQS
jgi:8-oxo-dGTP diphosphatase